MKITRQTKLDDEQKKQIFELWNNEYPERLAYQSIENLENYLNKLYNQTHIYYLTSKPKLMAGQQLLSGKTKNGLQSLFLKNSMEKELAHRC